jgi:hypothetical protein
MTINYNKKIIKLNFFFKGLSDCEELVGLLTGDEWRLNPSMIIKRD